MSAAVAIPQRSSALPRRVRRLLGRYLELCRTGDGRALVLADVRRLVWSTDEVMIMRRDNRLDHPIPSAKIDITVRPVGLDELRRILDEQPTDSASEQRDRAARTDMVDAGVAECWVAETTEGVPCHLDFFVPPPLVPAFREYTRGVFPAIGPNDAFAEGAYTFEAFRGLHLQAAVAGLVYADDAARDVEWIYGHMGLDSRSQRTNVRLGYEPHFVQIERFRFGKVTVTRRDL